MRVVRWLVVAALAAGGLFGLASPAKSLSTCGYVRLQAFTTTSVRLGGYCDNVDHPACEPGFPAVGPGSFIIGDFFVCVDH